MAGGDLILDYSDYTGNISDDEGVETRTIIFEEAGIDATGGWLVDPYLSVTEPAGEIVVTTSSEIVTFTVATETAVLKDSQPTRVVVWDDVCYWAIYDVRLFCYQHTAGTPGSGMALTTDHGVGFPYTVTGDWDWYPLTAAEETAKVARLAQFQADTIDITPTDGSFVDDQVLPIQIGGADTTLHTDLSLIHI